MTREQRRRQQQKKQRRYSFHEERVAIWILAALLSLSLLAAKAEVNTQAANELHQHNIEIGVTK